MIHFPLSGDKSQAEVKREVLSALEKSSGTGVVHFSGEESCSDVEVIDKYIDMIALLTEDAKELIENKDNLKRIRL